MHILVTNDDGPPSQQSSPYVHSLVKTLQDAGHTVSVILPHVQRSWIGKAHFVGKAIKPTYFRPGTLHTDDGTTHDLPLSEEEPGEEWVLVDGTPGTCAQLGLHHFFKDRGPIELVVSGPNYGRNSTSLFSLSSGTVGGAMEAATCRKKAIALSYAFFSRDHDPTVIAEASRLSLRVIEHLYGNWGEDVDLYTVNVPLIEGVEKNKIMYTNVLQNYWSSGSPFEEIEAGEDEMKAGERENAIRHQNPNSGDAKSSSGAARFKHKHFKWAPKFQDVHKSVDEAPPGNDGWAVKQGYTSITPLKANFMHAPSSLQGELKLSPTPPTQPDPSRPHIYALIDYEDPYVQPLILSALSTHFPPSSYTLLPSLASLPTPTSPTLLILPYESLPFDHLLAHPTTTLANSYIIRKALIRKHYLAHTITNYLAKNPTSPLKEHVPVTVAFELDYAEFLDDALLEAWELKESFGRNEEGAEREWWILKPSMSDRGQGIRLFSSEEELRGVFEEWDAENPEESDEEGEEDDSDGVVHSAQAHSQPSSPPPDTSTHASSSPPLPPKKNAQDANTGIMTSQLRHFVAQPYISPLLFPSLGNRKFHIRSYILAVGALKVYVYREMLALFAAEKYIPPGNESEDEGFGGGGGETAGVDGARKLDMRRHLTNTCLQDVEREGSVLRFWELPERAPASIPSTASSSIPTEKSSTADYLRTIFTQILTCTSHLFRAAAAQSTTFQPLPNAFEVFGVDWMVDERGEVWLLEVNAFPDFRQSGEVGWGVVEGFWKGVVGCVGGFGGGGGGENGEERNVGGDGGKEGDRRGQEKGEGKERDGMVRVLEMDMGRG